MTTFSSRSILVVDDEVDTCRNLADIFSDMGYEVDTANDGESALDLVRKRRYDVALLDLMMPGMDGATLYGEMKKLRAGTVALVVTAHPGHPRAEDALRAGVWKLLPKPVDLGRLMGTIEEAAGQPLILMVDDDTDFCASLWDVLRQRGYRLCMAHDAATAIRRVNEDHFNVVLLDMRLPDGNGNEVSRAVHQSDPGTQIIVITGCRTEMERQIEEMLSEGASTVLPKPLDIPALLVILQELAPKRTTGENVR